MDNGRHQTIEALAETIGACRRCAGRFAATATAHAPRPVVWLSDAPVLICGQAPGARVHASGRPFDDASGDRLRAWMGVDRDAFYDRRRFAVLPMAFCLAGALRRRGCARPERGRPGAAGAAAPVLAQHRMVEAQPLVRGGAAPRASRADRGGPGGGVMETPYDLAHRALQQDPESESSRLRLHERILDAELLLLLADEAAGDALRPEIYEVADGRFALAFDRDERLAEFVGAPAPFVALSGRQLVTLLAGQGVGLAMNLGSDSAALLPPQAVDWMARMVADIPEEEEAHVAAVRPPAHVPQPLLDALGPKLAAMAGVVEAAHLVEARHGAEFGLMLVLSGVPALARDGAVQGVAEAVRFAAVELSLDVTFLDPGDPGFDAVVRVGVAFEPPPDTRPALSAPGSDPARPPKLR
jgi:hypothetical protein